jgi:hypothetical protein
MIALALLLILLGILLIHAAISGKAFSSLIKGSSTLDTSAEPTLSTEPEAEKSG